MTPNIPRTYTELVQWIETNVPEDKRLPAPLTRTPDEHALWFVAYNIAFDFYDTSYDTDDLAHMFLNGIPAMSPERVDEYLASIWEEEGEEWFNGDSALLSSLHFHFGTGKTS